MIRLTSAADRLAHYVAPTNIARITEASAGSKWHGIRSIVKLVDGATLECEESAVQVNAMVEKAIEQIKE